MGLLDELQQLAPDMPEIEVFVPEWRAAQKPPFAGGKVTLRGLNVAEGRKVRKMLEKVHDGETIGVHVVAHSIVAPDGTKPFANKEGFALLETLSGQTAQRLMAAYRKVTDLPSLEEAEGNSGPRADGDGSSSDSPSPSADAQSKSSNGSLANPN